MGFSDNVKTQAFHRQNKKCGMCGDCHKYGAHGGNFRNQFSLDKDELKYFNG